MGLKVYFFYVYIQRILMGIRVEDTSVPTLEEARTPGVGVAGSCETHHKGAGN